MPEMKDVRQVVVGFNFPGPDGRNVAFNVGEPIEINDAGKLGKQIKAVRDQNRRVYVPASTVDALEQQGKITLKR